MHLSKKNILQITTLSLLTTFILTCGLFAEPARIQTISFDRAQKLAKKEKKDILVLVTSNSCGWCKHLKNVVLKDELVGSIVNNFFVCIDANCSTPEGKEVAADFKGKGYPRSYIVTTKGDEKDQLIGSPREAYGYLPFICKSINGNKKAMKKISKALENKLGKKPSDYSSKEILAFSYWHSGKKKKAVKLFGSSVFKKLSTAPELNKFSWSWAHDIGGRYKMALKAAQKAVKLERKPMYLDTLAYAYYKNKKYEKAVETQKEAIELGKGKLASSYQRNLEIFEKALKESTSKNEKSNK
jgi:tetratricopeptide (TPR) repeat protein